MNQRLKTLSSCCLSLIHIPMIVETHIRLYIYSWMNNPFNRNRPSRAKHKRNKYRVFVYIIVILLLIHETICGKCAKSNAQGLNQLIRTSGM